MYDNPIELQGGDHGHRLARRRLHPHHLSRTGPKGQDRSMNRSQAVEEPDLTHRARAAAAEHEPGPLDLPEVWGHGSFPASDPPANW
jgi:hypothetical protein